MVQYFWPDYGLLLELHTLTLATCFYALLRMINTISTNTRADTGYICMQECISTGKIWNLLPLLKIVMHKPLLLSTWPGVLYLVRFDLTMGFCWSYTLLLLCTHAYVMCASSRQSCCYGAAMHMLRTLSPGSLVKNSLQMHLISQHSWNTGYYCVLFVCWYGMLTRATCTCVRMMVAGCVVLYVFQQLDSNWVVQNSICKSFKKGTTTYSRRQ